MDKKFEKMLLENAEIMRDASFPLERTPEEDEFYKDMENVWSICARCSDINVPLVDSNCEEKPELLAGEPLGMYHCPDCGSMLLAGVPHPQICVPCSKRERVGWDVKE